MMALLGSSLVLLPLNAASANPCNLEAAGSKRSLHINDRAASPFWQVKNFLALI